MLNRVTQPKLKNDDYIRWIIPLHPFIFNLTLNKNEG